jgi:CubicO group peptidase (beta-lactamase class C family)
MSQEALSEFVKATAEEFGVPGLAVGVWVDGEEVYASHGVTSLENPLEITPDTLFALGSVSKTATATALMRLVAEGRVELDAPVRRYIPELALADEQTAAGVTVLNLLNHTSGLDWRLLVDTGDGDDALAEFVAKLADLELVAPLGARASYSQSAYSILGRIIEKVTGLTFERAVATLVTEPLGMANSFFFLDDIITRRFAVGHNAGEDGTLSVARQWRDNRANNPGAGLASSTSDLIRWAKFHLGDGRAESGEQIVPAEVLRQMQQPTVELRGSTLGDAFGLCWFLRDIAGVRTVGHGGSANGQFSDLLLVPERNFAVAVASNANPGGIPADQAVVRWALEHYLGVVEEAPEPEPYDDDRAREVAGDYENDVMTFLIRTDGSALTLEVGIKPAIRAASETEMPPDIAPASMGLLPGDGDGDGYIVTEGVLQGQRGFFSRDADGAVVGVDLAGRLFNRVGAAAE